MKTFILFISIFMAVTTVSAQSSLFLADRVSGNLYKNSNAGDIQGSAFFKEDWLPGVIYLGDGYRADKFLLKLDLYSNELLFQHEGQALAVVNPVKEFVLTSPLGAQYLFRCGYMPIDVNDEKTFYQVIANGPTSLLKHIRKNINERKEYGSAATIKEFITTESYFISQPKGVILKVKKDKRSLLDALGDDGKMEAWMAKNKIKIKSEQDLVNVVNAWNQNLHKN